MDDADTRRGRARGIDRRRLLCLCCASTVLAYVPTRVVAAPEAVAAAEEPHHHVLFVNADLRLMRILIPPGDSTGWHRHAHDFVITVLRGTKTRTETAGESQAAIGEMVTDSIQYGSYDHAPIVHRVANGSSWLNHQLGFEILAGKPGGLDPDRSGAPQFAVAFDNPRLRAWRLKLAPGEFTAPIVQRGAGVRIILSGDRIIDTPAMGTPVETDVRGGDAAYLAPDRRSVTNAGNSPLDLIEFELK